VDDENFFTSILKEEEYPPTLCTWYSSGQVRLKRESGINKEEVLGFCVVSCLSVDCLCLSALVMLYISVKKVCLKLQYANLNTCLISGIRCSNSIWLASLDSQRCCFYCLIVCKYRLLLFKSSL